MRRGGRWFWFWGGGERVNGDWELVEEVDGG